MEKILKEFLFTKGILVCEVGGKFKDPVGIDHMETAYGLSLRENGLQVHPKILPFVEEQLGKDMPQGFYRNFPMSVRSFSVAQLLYEQVCRYVEEEKGEEAISEHSVFEDDTPRPTYQETPVMKPFSLLFEKDARMKLGEMVEDMLSSAMPLNMMQHRVLQTYVRTYRYKVTHCACRNTAMHLLLDTRDVNYGEFLELSDVVQVAQMMNDSHGRYPYEKNFALPNQDRKLLTSLMDYLFEHGKCDVENCFEKKATWNRLLHHIHYQAKTTEAQLFVNLMRGRENFSAYAKMEAALQKKDIHEAVEQLYQAKGGDGVLKHLTYLVSRCRLDKDVNFVLEHIQSSHPVHLLQAYVGLHDKVYTTAGGERSIVYERQGKLMSHREENQAKPKLSLKRSKLLRDALRAQIAAELGGKLGRVYISPEMYDVALPLWECDGVGGMGVRPKGTRVAIPVDKKIRVFVSWQGSHDVDLSVMALQDTAPAEFSWRTMGHHQGQAIAYSGDALAVPGKEGMAEYLDIDINGFSSMYPDAKYLVVCCNVYSGKCFDRFACRSGYMLRDIADTGEVFEPSTVSAIFDITCKSTFFCPFAIDLKKGQLVWLNSAQGMDARIAAKADFSFVEKWMSATHVVNVGWLFEQMATEVVTDVENADVVVSDTAVTDNPHVLHIRSCDVEKIQAMLA